MKAKGFRKHHAEVEAENEKEAIFTLNRKNDDYLKALADFSGDILILSVIIITLALVYFFN